MWSTCQQLVGGIGIGGNLTFVAPAIDTRPVGPADLADLARLFQSQRSTRHCWCMAFCTTRSQFAIGWFGGGNRHRFEAMARADAAPMGVLASVAGEPVGWCACGPRSRYAVATSGRSTIRSGRARDEDRSVWLVPCLFVRADRRGQGITYALVGAAVELARSEGASAIEGWPLAGPDRQSADAFLGREKVFEDLGFHCVERPTPQRAIMRLALRDLG
jgi:GNAT superfamily N-acetyltransferase